MPLEIVRNDITKMPVDAIVNAANRSLLGGGGVDGAIHRAAGPELLAECRTLGGCETGQAKITKGYRLPCRFVIHTVGPVWHGGGYGERELLASCYRQSLKLAKDNGCESVAFPLISAGAYGYPKGQALRVAVDEISSFLMGNDMRVYLVVFTRTDFDIGGKLFDDIRAYIDDVYVDEHYDADRESVRGRLIQEQRGGIAPRPDNAPMAGSAPMDDSAMFQSEAMPMDDGAMFQSGTSTMDDDAMFQSDATVPRFSFGRIFPSLRDMLKQVDESFSETLLRRIDERGMTDAECYKRANIDRRLFNKIKNNPSYRPGKQTALAFAVALRLNLDETRDLLMKAGYALSHSSKSDIVVEYCITHGVYDIFEINEVLFKLDLQPLGY